MKRINVQTSFVMKRSELTQVMTDCASGNISSYRVKVACGCEKHNGRFGVLVVENNIIIAQVIRCRECTKGGKR